MKNTLLLLLLNVFQIYASNSYSQKTNLTMDLRDMTVKEVLSRIEDQSEFFFLYNSKLIEVNRITNINVKDQKIDKILAELFDKTDVAYFIYDKQIILSPKEYLNSVTTKIQQPRPVSGSVSYQNGDPLLGVTVIVKGSSQGTITDAQGKFSLTNVPENGVLVFSFVGMQTREITVGNQTTINVTMVEELIGIEEVVAIGYGTIRKADLTGSIATVSTKDFGKVPASSPLQILQGRAAGIQITSSSGMPGSGSDVLIRGVRSINGTNSPIYVVDGVIRTTIDDLNPNSIESVSILKDASAAAIYGARAANGVVLITTKRGTKKELEITLNAYYGIQTESNMKLKLLNAGQWLDLFTESYENSGTDIPWDAQILSHYTGVDTDWIDLIMDNGAIQNYDLSVLGGSEKSNYYVSANFMDNKGMVMGTRFNKYALTFNSDHKIKDWITFGNSFSVFSQKRQGTANEIGGPFNMAMRKVPLTRAYEADGDYGIIYNTTLEHMHANPLWMAREYVNESTGEGVFGNLYLTLKLLKGLEFTTRGSMDYNNSYSTLFVPSLDPHYGWEGTASNRIDKNNYKTIHWISDFLLNYNTTILDNHDIKILLGYSLERSGTESLGGSRTGTPNNEIQYLDAGDPTTQINSNGYTDWGFTSVFGRLNYTFKNKYLFTGTVRRDGTSRLVGDNRYGIFPSASVAWRASEESFLKDIDLINDLKIRASYGTLGNILSVGTYGTIASLSTAVAVLNGAGASAYTLNSPVNSDLKWESVTKKNFGLDATILNNRLYTTIDFFIENTYDLLFSNPIPLSTGMEGEPLINAGEVKNTGYEIELGYRGKKSDWTYDVSINLSHVRNEVMDLGGRNLRTSGLLEGYPVRSYFGYKSNGLITDASQLNVYQTGSFTTKQVGDIRLLDIDGYDNAGNLTGTPDGKVDAADRTFIGNRYPDLTYGALGTLGYKSWSIQVQLQGVHGYDIQYLDENAWYSIHYLMSSMARNEDARVLRRYHPTKNPNGTWPRLSISDTGKNKTFSEFWLEDASYLRVRNINLNYVVPKAYAGKIGMKDLSLYLSIQNLYTFTQYEGPEVDTQQDPMTGAIQPRTWTLGLRATF